MHPKCSSSRMFLNVLKSEEGGVGNAGGGQLSISGDLGSKETVCQQPYVAHSSPVLLLGILSGGGGT